MSKKGNKVIWLLPVGLIILFVFLFQPCFSRAQKIEIKTEKGVEIVRNPKTPVRLPGGPSKVILKEELVIGKETEKEDYWFSMLNSVAVDDSGNIYTCDPKEVKIRVFNPKGTLLRAFGRKGQGPREYRGPGQMKVMPDGSLIVHDVLNRRITYLKLNGTVLKMVSIKTLPRGSSKVDSRGSLYLYKRGFGKEKVLDELIKYDSSHNQITKFHSTWRKWSSRAINPYPVRFLYEVSADDNFIWLLSSSYRIHVIDPEGKILRRIVKDHDPIEITEEDKNQYKKANPLQEIRGIRFEYEFPKYYPVADRLIVDDQDRIYIRTYEKDSRGNVYHDVFDPEGRYFARFSLPENELVQVLKNNKLYCIISESEEGIPLAKRYSMKWE